MKGEFFDPQFIAFWDVKIAICPLTSPKKLVSPHPALTICSPGTDEEVMVEGERK